MVRSVKPPADAMWLHDSGGAAGRRAAAAPWLLIPLLWLLAAAIASTPPQAVPWHEVFAGNLVVFGWRALLAPAVVLAVRAITRRVAPLPLRLLAHGGAAAAFVAVDLALLAVARPDRFRAGLPESVAVYAVIALAALALTLHGRARSAASLERQLHAINLRCNALKLHPHFVFNALHAVAALIDVRPQDAQRMLARLSDLLRTAVAFMEAAEVPLTREVEWIEQYVELQQIRHEEQLEIDIEIAPEAVRAMVPPLVLQPLVENSIKHGIEKRAGGGRIAIAAERAGDLLRLCVRDDGPGPGARAAANGVGLGNTRARLETMYGGRSSVTLRAAEGGGAEAIVEIPFREKAS